MIINLEDLKEGWSIEEWYRKQPYFSEERLNKIYEWQKAATHFYTIKEEA